MQYRLDELRRVANDRLDKLEKSAGGNILLRRQVSAQRQRILDRIAVSESKLNELDDSVRQINVDGPQRQMAKLVDTEIIQMSSGMWLLYLLGGSTLMCGLVASSLLLSAQKDAEFARKLRRTMPYTAGVLDMVGLPKWRCTEWTRDILREHGLLSFELHRLCNTTEFCNLR